MTSSDCCADKEACELEVCVNIFDPVEEKRFPETCASPSTTVANVIYDINRHQKVYVCKNLRIKGVEGLLNPREKLFAYAVRQGGFVYRDSPLERAMVRMGVEIDVTIVTEESQDYLSVPSCE
jgi:hypothetical protein